jgi:adenine specific DNA methylase Mod
LFFGDNLEVLRDHIEDCSVDLVYLDPPFNSNANYNVLFRERSGTVAQSQAEAFCDTWTWGPMAEQAFHDVMASNEAVSHVMQGWRNWLRESAMMAYLTMMATRMVELRRVLKPTGSLYLHCDPVASHYLKVLLDAIFGPVRFRSELIWKRTSAHSNTGANYGDVTDTILYYSRDKSPIWNKPTIPLSQENIDSKYTYREADGRRYSTRDLRNPGVRPNLRYDYKGYKPHPNGWSISREKMEEYDRQGRIYYPSDKGGRLRLKIYLDEAKGQPMQNLWDDIPPLNSQAQERLGYPTQKPTALLERIIEASSNPGDVVLDPFCGCGTTVDAAEKLHRNWIGIDVTHYAITLIEQRLKRYHPTAKFTVHGRPASLADAEALAKRDKHQFQWWAAWFVGAQSYREEKRGPDRGIDGSAVFANGPFGYGRVIISVKAGENVGVDMVRQLRAVVDREKAEMGILVTLAPPTQPMINEALGVGYVAKSAHGRLPRLQIVTAADLFAGRLPVLPPLPQALDGARPRSAMPRRIDKRQLSLMLAFNGSDTLKAGGAFIDPRYLTFGVQGEQQSSMLELPLEATGDKPSTGRRPPAASYKGGRTRELPLDTTLLSAPQAKRRRA